MKKQVWQYEYDCTAEVYIGTPAGGPAVSPNHKDSASHLHLRDTTGMKEWTFWNTGGIHQCLDCL